MSDIVLATGNKGKVAELSALLSPLNFNVIPQSDFAVPNVPETGLTFVENALIKARHAAKVTGLPAIADDSGIAVDALEGCPGIYSARYAGEDASDSDNIDKLLAELNGKSNRNAQFHCVLVFLKHALDPTPIICHGTWAGTITENRSGDSGFGYDPIFWVEKAGRTAAQMTKEEKNKVSHRAIAMTQLLAQLTQN